MTHTKTGEKPTISQMIHHIKKCPSEFLRRPIQNKIGETHTAALVNDLLRSLSNQPTAVATFALDPQSHTLAELHLMQISCWALSHPFFSRVDTRLIAGFLKTGLKQVAGLVKTESWITDEERAEELARMIFSACNEIPAGESSSEAQDRLTSVDTVNRIKVIEKSRKAMERAKELRRKMAEEKAREAANIYGRE